MIAPETTDHAARLRAFAGTPTLAGPIGVALLAAAGQIDRLRDIVDDQTDEHLRQCKENADLRAQLAAIGAAIRDYHYALDTRQHGGIAQDRAFEAICEAMGMHWRQGEEKARREGTPP